ncbi:hypothetical protein QYS49_07835 [Marivirga salinae]|uniref:Uncharacterized protein n=1 Tax=Marivirga salinarum TaxID=3059078 RepID=A0AA49J8V4_9BACT|nr:hypothetical protein [Marivirga sp. BDSF4-3]WKK77111.2 hypothetical protein QYS49_07835 [Marivirga sp. BDSF4-3]
MQDEMNIKKRAKVLEFALSVESSITKLVLLFLNVSKEDLKALGNKNSSLSFKNKIDLLFDIGVLSKDENQKLLLLMEFRNQFLHNITCNSFCKAIELLGSDRAKKLLTFSCSDFENNLENQYSHCFSQLHLDCLQLIHTKYEIKYQKVKQKRETITDIIDYSKYIIEKDTELILSLSKKFSEMSNNDSEDLKKFKNQLSKFIELTQTELTKSSELKLLREVAFDKKKINELLN